MCDGKGVEQPARVRDGKRTDSAQKSISELEAKRGGVLIYNSDQNISPAFLLSTVQLFNKYWIQEVLGSSKPQLLTGGPFGPLDSSSCMMHISLILTLDTFRYEQTNGQGDSCIHDAYIYEPLSLNLGPDVYVMHISMTLDP